MRASGVSSLIDPARRDTVLWVLAETIRRVTLLVQPFMPDATAKILDQLAIAPEKRAFAAFDGELTSDERKEKVDLLGEAERRVLILENPGLKGRSSITHTLYAGLQLILPGEVAPAHRHTQTALRFVVEGEGAYTTVDGEKCPMSRGDLILTPTGLWHEHGHDGKDPVVWLDVLDLPVVYYLETSYAIEGQRQTVKQGRGDQVYARGGLMPTTVFQRSDKRYPMLRYPWVEARAALQALRRPDLKKIGSDLSRGHEGEPKFRA